MRSMRDVAAAGLVVAAVGWAGLALAAPGAEEQKATWDAAAKAAQRGPVDVALAGEAVLHVPDGEAFIPKAEAARLLAVMGNPGEDPDLQGMLMPRDADAGWFMVVDWKAAGYVKDDDAKTWNADELLDSYRKGTDEANKQRVEMGLPALEIVGWAEAPKYDPATQRLAWAMSSRHRGAGADADQGVNYNTYALGRDGYFELNMVAGLAQLPALKPVAAQQLAALQFDAGKRYADFDAKTDHVAEYGLAALVVGVAAKKLGLIALGAAFFAKFAKIIVIALAAFGGGFMKFFRRKPAPAPAPALAGPAFATAAPVPAPPAPAPAPLPPLDLDLDPATDHGHAPAPEAGGDAYAPTQPMPLHGPGDGKPAA